jgi:hypothetical protein
MGLPNSRETLPNGPGSIVPAATILAIEDSIIGHKRPSFVRPFWPKAIHLGGWTTTTTGTTIPVITSSVSGIAWIEIPCEEGDRITGVTVEAFGNGTADTQFNVQYATSVSGVNSPTLLAAMVDSNRAAAWGVVALTPFTPQVIGAGGSLLLSCQANATGYLVALGHATFDRL